MELGLRGSVIIALSIPHMLHWDSGGCHQRPQDPSYATLGLRGVSSSPSGSLICYTGTQRVSSSPSGSLICYIGTQGGVIIALRIPHMLHWDSGGVIITLRIPHMLQWDSGVSSSPSGSLICYTGTQGGVLITLRIPHMLHWPQWLSSVECYSSSKFPERSHNLCKKKDDKRHIKFKLFT